MNSWNCIRLGDVCCVNTEAYSEKERWDYVHYLDTGNITKNCIDEIQYIDLMKEKLPSRARRKVKYNSILYSTVRPNQCHYGIVKEQSSNFLVSTGFSVIDVIDERVDADFLYCYLTMNAVTEKMHAIAEQSTSAYPAIKSSDIEDLELKLPDILTQKRIASFLMSLEHKITNNTKLNKNLEEQAQAIFNAWFVDLLPFNRKIPSDWKILKFADIAELSAGGDKPAIVSETKSKECPYPIYANGIAFNGLYGYTNIPRVKAESVTISARGTIGFVCLRNIPYVPIVRLITAIPKEHLVSAKYLYFWLKHIPIAGTGTTQQQLTIPAFKNTEILVPPIDIIIEFTDKVSHLFNLRYLYETEIETLTSLRDALLPRLMSGELDVSNIEL